MSPAALCSPLTQTISSCTCLIQAFGDAPIRRHLHLLTLMMKKLKIPFLFSLKYVNRHWEINIIKRDKLSGQKKSFTGPQLVQHSSTTSGGSAKSISVSFSWVVFCRVERVTDPQLVCIDLCSFLFPRYFLAEAVIKFQTFSDSARLQWFGNDAWCWPSSSHHRNVYRGSSGLKAVKCTFSGCPFRSAVSAALFENV